MREMTKKSANTIENKENNVKKNDLLEMYRQQTVNEGQHDYHVDGYYGDYSDACCC